MKNKIALPKLAKYAAFGVLLLAAYLILPSAGTTSKYMMKIINEGLIYFIAVLGLSVVLG